LIKFVAAALRGVVLLEIEALADDRGFFARTYCADEFKTFGLDMKICQCSISYNKAARTLRGLHFQQQPFAEEKLVRCTSGAIVDVVVDIREASPTLGRWFATELTQQNRRSLFIPKGFAHGFVTLTDNSEVSYMMSEPFHASAARGFRWDDGLLGIEWPVRPEIISPRDASYPPLRSLEFWRL
jgi:dTDP-4-dehydrorhamnose 3,5-epimerase